MKKIILMKTLICAVLSMSWDIAGAAEQVSGAKYELDIPSQDLHLALQQVASSSHHKLLYKTSLVAGKVSSPVKGLYTTQEAVQKVLSGTGLTFEITADSVVLIRDAELTKISQDIPAGEQIRLAQSEESVPEAETSPAKTPAHSAPAIPEIFVKGSRSLNMDIERTEDDVQPFVVFGAREIAQSGALNVEDFLKNRLPMNSQKSVESQRDPLSSLQGGINLRGLGTDQTLVLVDGRRLPGVANGFNFEQPGLAGIPIAAIERIEVLPSTASGIYGGGATGGVINIILKHDYDGFDVEATYGNSFRTDIARVQASVYGGFAFEEGRTRVSLQGAYSKQDDLAQTDRNFTRRAGDRYMQNLANLSPANAVLAVNSLRYSLYGSTPNVFSSDGSPLVLDSGFGGQSLGSGFTYVPSGYAGPASDGAAGLLQNAGRLNFDDNSLRLLQAPETDSIGASIRREFSSHVEAFVDLNRDATHNDALYPASRQLFLAADSPNNPFEQSIYVNLPLYSFGQPNSSDIENRRARAGLIFHLPRNWNGSVEYGLERSKIETRYVSAYDISAAGQTALPAFALTDPTAVPIPNLESLLEVADQLGNRNTNTLRNASLRWGGSLFALPGGALTLSGLLEQREEKSDSKVSSSVFPSFGTFYIWTPPASQRVDSGYVELRAPVISASNSMTAVNAFEVMASVRHDRYKTRYSREVFELPGPLDPPPVLDDEDFSENTPSSTDYTIGVRYAPVADLAFRASYGTGFIVPRLDDIGAYPAVTDFAYNTAVGFLSDPLRGGEFLSGDPNSTPPGLVTVISGGNPDLDPEEARSFSGGFIWTPRFIDGLRASVDYTEIRKTNEIGAEGASFILDNEARFPGRIIRAAPSDDDIAQGWAGPIIYFDQTSYNLARSKIRAVDLQLDYTRAFEQLGALHFFLIGTRALKFEQQAFTGSAALESAGFSDGPLKWRGNFGVDWENNAWVAGWNAQYFDSYKTYGSTSFPSTRVLSQALQGSDEIASQLYHDVFVRYRFGDSGIGNLLSNLDIALGIQNVLDKKPPPVVMSLSYSQYGDPRLRRFTLTLRKASIKRKRFLRNR